MEADALVAVIAFNAKKWILANSFAVYLNRVE